MKQFYKGTDGKITAFRATERAYAAVGTTSKFGGHNIAFGGKISSATPYPVVAISKQEYEALVALKAARVAKLVAKAAAEGRRLCGEGMSPQDSWVWNADIAAEQVAA